MKYALSILLFACFCFIQTNAQNVARVEYFTDTDPGIGNGTPVAITAGADITASFQVNTNALTAGFHNLYVRSLVNPFLAVVDGSPVAKGGWSLTQVRTFYKESISSTSNILPNITRGEYFIDTDPGFGAATNIPLTAGADISNLAFTFDVTSLGTGFHNLYVRFRDANGRWGLCSVRNFYKEAITAGNNQLPNINKGEYFIDTDPGFGSATNIPVTAAADITNLNFTFDITSLTPGFHNLYVRFRDANGRWSHASIHTFYKENLTASGGALPNITGGEYFIDTDPGFGAGINIPVVPATDASNISFAANLTNLPAGFHNLYVRFRDANGRWSHSNVRSFYKEVAATTAPLQNIVRFEYYVDTDPGFGSGTPVPVTPATDISSFSFPVNMLNVSIGNHKIYVRALDAGGKWSLVSNGSFVVQPPAAIYITVGNLPATACAGAAVAIPFTVNTPYGSNNIFTAQLSNASGSFAAPVNIGSFTGNNNNNINATIPANTPAGAAYRVRIISSSPVDTSAASSTAIAIGRVPELAYSITGAAQACAGLQAYSASAVEQNTTYTWALSGGGTIAANGASANVTWTTPGTYTLSLTASNSCGAGATRTLSVIVSAGTPTITASGPLSFCQGGSVTLTSSAANGNLWSNGATTQSITVTSSGAYHVTVGGTTCPSTSADVVVTVAQSIVATFASIAPICAGAIAPVLPLTSVNGIAGTWSPATVSNSATGNYTFTPSTGSCVATTVITVVVNPVVTPVFAAIPPIAYGSVAPLLPATSQNGISGNWSPATVSNTQTRTYTFTPSSGNCVARVIITIVVSAFPDLAIQNVTSGPTSVSANDVITINWRVANVGTAPSQVNWTENIYMQAPNGDNRTLLKQTIFTNTSTVGNGQSILRSDVVTIPAQINIGDQGVFVVELIPGASVQEATGTSANNTGIQATAWTVAKKLGLQLTSTQLSEGAANGITASVTRSGLLTSPLTLNISLRKPARYSFPSTITIPVGQSGVTFDITALDNTRIEGTILDTLLVVATGFQSASANISILDNDNPTLTITGLPSSATEGQTVNFRVNTNLAPAVPLQVYLSSSSNSQFPLPASITIPAGALFANVSVILGQDNVPEVDLPVQVIAGAANLNSANASITIKDDDVPGLQLVMQTNIISEAAGFYATQATLRRTAGSNPLAFTASLSATPANNLILPPSISLAAGENEKTFTIGVIDNQQVDGQRSVAVTASIFVNSCGCSAPPNSAGYVSAGITISDNDGPSLTLTANPLTLAEGSANAGTLTITRNTPTTQPLTVNLVSADLTEVTLPATATIPAGAASVNIPIATVNDGIADGSQQVNLQASVAGFSPGAVWVLVTDQNKPDLQLPGATISSNTLQATAVFNYQVSVKNSGFATAPTGVVVRGYLSKDDLIDESDSLITEDTIPGAITVGQTVQVINAATAPDLPGQYKLLFKVNPAGALTELLYSNNTAQPLPVTINPDYTATASIAQPYYLKGATINITGNATRNNGSAAANKEVEVYIITDGLRRVVTATTNASGAYTTQFVPLANEAGHYTAGASFPGLNATATQDQFDILGVKINDNTPPQYKVIINDTITGLLSVQNLSNTPLTKFTIAPVTLPAGAVVRFDTIASVAANAAVNIGYRVVGTALTGGTNFTVANFQAVANEGVIQPFNTFYYCQAPNGFIVADISNIKVSVSQSTGERLVECKLINNGTGNTGDIKISLPQVNWLSTVSPQTIPSLASGDSALVIFKFSATPDVPFNYPLNGTIVISAANGNALTIPFSFEKVSLTTGIVKVIVTDQFTYLTDAAPKVKDAAVKIENYFTGEVYAEGLTNADGIFLATGIPEGRHRITVDKEKHLPYNSTVTINPGDTVTANVFINYQAVTFSWNVVPTAVQDQYDITLTTQFETNVPIPVVTIDMPKTMPQLFGNDVYAFNATLTNHGLITALEVTLNLPQADPEYEFVTNYVPADLLAQQSIQVPVIMRRRAGALGGKAGGLSYKAISQFLGIAPPQNSTLSGGGSNCEDFVGVVYGYKCNFSTGLWQQTGVLFTYTGRSCTGTGGGGNGILIGGGGFPYNGNGIYFNLPCLFCGGTPPGGTGTTPPYTNSKKSCVECINDIIGALANCAPGPIGTGVGIASCATGAYLSGGGVTDYIQCIPGLSPPQSCLQGLIMALLNCSESGGFGGGGAARPAANAGRPGTAAKDGQTTLAAPLGSAFKQIGDNLQVAADAFRVRENWAREYFGDMLNSNAWNDLSPLLDPYVTVVDSIRPNAQASILAAMAGYEIQQSTIQAFFVRWNTSVHARSLGILSANTQYPGIINWRSVKAWSDSMVTASNDAISKGYTSVYDMYLKQYSALNEIIDAQNNQSVCASVTVQLSQQLTMTREAFEGTLEIFNGHPTDKMDSLSVNIVIKDENGVPSNGLFEIQTKSLTNIGDITGTGNISAQQKGLAKFLFIPEIGAAPTAPKLYNFGGSVRYFDPYAKAMVTLPLSEVPLTVNPSPNLFLHYFMERNILGDDPLTKPGIEPSVPAELAVMVENSGYGPAVNMTISSAQPKIIDNEKGLAIEFKLVGSNFQGEPANLGVTNINFHTIPPLETRIGQWYMTSSLLGKFVSYDAKVVHANSFGNPDLSLVNGVKLHELTKSIKEYGSAADGINDFLVNDFFDPYDRPDIIYFSQGKRTATVYAATSGSFSSLVLPPSFTNTLTVTASDTGWNYIKLSDPGSGRYELASVTRSDGQVIPLNNAWLTFVTLPVSRPPVYENNFHFVDIFPSKTPVTYTVVWKPKNLNVPKIVSIDGAPEAVSSTQVQQLTVVFDKAIDPGSFTYQDLALTFQGGSNIITPAVTITRVDSATFTVNLSSITNGNGFYNFTVQAAGIADIYGINGATGKNITWTQFLTVPTVQAYQGLPPGNVATAINKIQVLFNLPIDSTTATANKFSIHRNGVALPGNITIDSITNGSKLFYLSGLQNILTQNGQYYLVVDLPNIKTTTQLAGLQKDSVLLTIDNTGPVVVSLAKSDSGGLDPQHFTFVKIRFSEAVVGFNTASLRLTRNGDAVSLNIAQLSNTDLQNWLAGNFGFDTYPDGSYTFTVLPGGFTDALGNVSTGTQQINWTVNRANQILITNLSVTPDRGSSNTDGITDTRSLGISFTLSSGATQVKISQTDLSGETVLVTRSNVAAGNVAVSITMLSGGSTGIKITATGSNGAEATVQKGLFIDEVPLAGNWIFAANQQIVRQPDTIPLQFSAKLLTGTSFLSAVAFSKNGTLLPSAGLRFAMVNDTLYNVYGLRQAGSGPGAYQLDFNLTPFSKFKSGTAGTGKATVAWTVLSANRPPVANPGSDITVNAVGVYSLSATGSYDPDLDPITYKWVAPKGIVLSDSTSASPTFTISTSNQLNNYPFLLIVNDGSLISTKVLTVNVNRLVSFTGLSGSYCVNAGLVTLTGTPSGGTFSGPGITSNTFNPAAAGAGAHTIVYTKDGVPFSVTTTVQAIIVPTFNPIAAFCPGTTAPLLPQRSLNNITGIWNPAVVSNSISATYTFIPLPGQCAATATLSVTILPRPNLGADITADKCAGTTYDLTAEYKIPGLTYNYFTSNFAPLANHTAVEAGVYNIIATNSNGCKDTVQVTVTNYPKPNLGADITRSKCAGIGYNLTTVYNPAGLTYTYFTQAFAPLAAPAAVEAGVYNIIASNSNGCKDTAQVTVTNYLKPNLGEDTSLYHVCAGETSSLLSLYPTAGLTAVWNTATPAAVPPGIYTLIVTNASGCRDTARVSVLLDVATWTGNTSTNWHEPGNWNTNAIPTGQTHVIIPAGTERPCNISTEDAVAASVQVRAGAILQVTTGRKLVVMLKCGTLPAK